MTTIKWKIAVIIISPLLPLIALGFAAMSTNPSFTIPSWVPLLFFVLAGIDILVVGFYLLFPMIRRIRLKQGKRSKMIIALGFILAIVGIGLIISQVTMPKEITPILTTPNTAKLSVLMLGGNVFVPNGSDMQEQLTGIALTGKVWNTGTPSVAVEWSLTVTLKGQAAVSAQWTQIPEVLTLNGTPNSTVIHSSDALDKKTANSPIGDTPIEGTLLFYGKLPKTAVLDPSTRLDLSVRDIYGDIASSTHLVGDWLQR